VLCGRTGFLQDVDERRKGIQGDIRHHQATIDQKEAEKKENPENAGNKNNSA